MFPGDLSRRGLLHLAFPLLLSCGPDCDREGCDALSRHASTNATGIAGVGAGLSDSVANGCAECPFTDLNIEVWPTDSPVSSKEEALAVTRVAPPTFSVTAAPNYSLPLDPGAYLVCQRPSCVLVHVSSGTTTVNVRLTEGPPLFFVAEPPASEAASTLGFDVGFATN